MIPEVNQTVIDALAFRQAILLDLVKNENFNNVIVERDALQVVQAIPRKSQLVIVVVNRLQGMILKGLCSLAAFMEIRFKPCCILVCMIPLGVVSFL